MLAERLAYFFSLGFVEKASSCRWWRRTRLVASPSGGYEIHNFPLLFTSDYGNCIVISKTLHLKSLDHYCMCSVGLITAGFGRNCALSGLR